jgi:hypothetical protein
VAEAVRTDPVAEGNGRPLVEDDVDADSYEFVMAAVEGL